MKFICPKCNKETEIEVCMTDCIVSETIKFDVDGDPEYGTPKIHESSELALPMQRLRLETSG